ncbi:MAG: hypothetical protein ACLQFW_14645 [Xanthobacteraceae bacterium]
MARSSLVEVMFPEFFPGTFLRDYSVSIPRGKISDEGRFVFTVQSAGGSAKPNSGMNIAGAK